MTEETRVGYKATSVLEEECLEYIKAHMDGKDFTGDIRYLVAYNSLKVYNTTGINFTESSQ